MPSFAQAMSATQMGDLAAWLARAAIAGVGKNAFRRGSGSGARECSREQ
jgi:hypothetical protein